MPEPTHSIDRAIDGLTLELNRNFKRAELQYDELGLQEVWQQYQLDITGSDAQWGYYDIVFDSPFVYAPTRRRNFVVVPHASFAVYSPIEDPDTAAALAPADFLPPKIYACVTHYTRDEDSDAFTGARVFVEVTAIGTDPDNPVVATLHATFQGYATWSEDEDTVG